MKGRGDQAVSVFSTPTPTPTLTLPRRRGRELLGKFQISLDRFMKKRDMIQKRVQPNVMRDTFAPTLLDKGNNWGNKKSFLRKCLADKMGGVVLRRGWTKG
ncbi:MAG: hypothetical protein A2V86_04000 [Deltaproteobacteria bacterium RBG_16_49_23]|nr:MAG: hypothetical protein A2V86_04000 [Deltaproteobacteria bacterium RBG_16_49_23]